MITDRMDQRYDDACYFNLFPTGQLKENSLSEWQKTIKTVIYLHILMLPDLRLVWFLGIAKEFKGISIVLPIILALNVFVQLFLNQH